MPVNQGAKEGAVVPRTFFLALLSVNAMALIVKMWCANVIKSDVHEDEVDE